MIPVFMELKHFRYYTITLYTILRFQFVVSVMKKKNSVHKMRANNEGLLIYCRLDGQERLLQEGASELKLQS